MNKPIQLIVEVLHGNVLINDSPVKLVKQASPIDQTPCITIDDSGGAVVLQKHITNKLVNGEPVQVLRERKNTTIQIQVWCDTEKERETITNQITQLFNRVQTDHYMYCQQYNNGECETLEKECQARNNTTNKRGAKQQCPYPTKYQYSNLFSKYDIIRNTFNLEPPFTLDDTTTKQPVLRSIYKLTMTYHTDYIIGGNTIHDLKPGEELL